MICLSWGKRSFLQYEQVIDRFIALSCSVFTMTIYQLRKTTSFQCKGVIGALFNYETFECMDIFILIANCWTSSQRYGFYCVCMRCSWKSKQSIGKNNYRHRRGDDRSIVRKFWHGSSFPPRTHQSSFFYRYFFFSFFSLFTEMSREYDRVLWMVITASPKKRIL